MRFLANVGLGLIGLDTITDFATLVSGRDPLTGEIMTPYDNALTFLALIIPGATGGAVRQGADFLAGYGDDVAHTVGAACSFDADTPVATDKGDVPIRDVAVGDRVLAWHEETGATGYYTVTAVWGHEDPITVQLVINGETIDTTPEHPFLTTNSEWGAAGELQVDCR